MLRGGAAFFVTRVVDRIVRRGEDVQLPNDRNSAAIVHNGANVYGEMFAHVCVSGASIGDFRTLTLDEIVFFYDCLRPQLKRHTAPRAESASK